jgi:hypothetical protein
MFALMLSIHFRSGSCLLQVGTTTDINGFLSVISKPRLNRCINLSGKSFPALHLKDYREFSGSQRTSLLVAFAPPP